ncbi:MAG: peptidoglycan-binding domain-containing protein [bacterium]|nr:peptidoglycan-binding domain-containing protein [bacterium]
MSYLYKSQTKKFVAGFVGLALAFSLVGVQTASAALTTDQVNTIIALLQSFGVDQTTINNVHASLTGGTPTAPPSGTPTTGYTFNRNLMQGSSGEDVRQLQMILNQSADTRIASSGVGSPGSETTYFGALTKTAVIKFQNKYAASVLAPVGLSSGTGYVGPATRDFLNSLGGGTTPPPSNGGGTTPPPPTGTGLKVMLAPDSPFGVALVQGQAVGELAKFTFANPTSVAINVTNLAFKRIGTSADSTLSNVYLFQGATRITDAAGISNTAFSYNNPNGVFTVPAGGTVTISVRSDITASTGGEQVGVQLDSVSASGTLDSSATFPITGGIQTISSATLGTLTFTYTGPDGGTENPANDVRVFETQAVVGTHAMNLESIAFENRGTSSDGDLRNIRLFIDGVQVGSAVGQFTDKRATFDLTASPVRLETGTRIIKVTADVVKGSSETYNIQIRRAADVRARDIQLGQPVLSSSSFAIAAGSANTIAAGSLSVSRSTDSPSGNVTVGATNVLWSKFDVRATGEDVKIEAVTVDVDTTAGDGMDNVKVFVNGVQVGSTKDVGSASSETGTEFTFGSSFIARAGETMVVEIYGDAKEADATNFAAAATIDVGFSIAAADTEAMNSGDTVSAVAEVEGFSRTMSATSLTASKSSGFGNQTYVAGSNNVKVGSFTLAAGSTEGVNVNTITIELSSDESASVTNLMLKDSSSGAQLGTTKASPSTSNGFSVNFTIPASGSKTIDVYADFKAGSNAGSWTAQVDTTSGGNGAMTAQSATVGSDLVLQTITLGSGTLTVAANTGATPADYIALAGTSDVKVGSFRFTAQDSQFTVQELKIKIPANAATSVETITLKWDGGQASRGIDDVSTGAAETHSTSTFAGLDFEIPKNTEKNLDVYVKIPTLADAGANISGRAISALIDFDEGFKAIDAAGTVDDEAADADLNSAGTSGRGTVYVRDSVPTISAAGDEPTTLSSGETVLGRVTIKADNAADITWKQIMFKVSKGSGVQIGATTTLALWRGNTQVTGVFATTTATDGTGTMESFAADATTGDIVFIVGTRTGTTEEEIGKGESATYELRGSVTGVGTGDHLRISVEKPSTAVVTDSFADIAGSIADTGHSFVWSDRSSTVTTVHAVTTDDWADDYLVNTLPVTIGDHR